MSDAADRLARTRLAIIEQIHKSEPRSEPKRRREHEPGQSAAPGSPDGEPGGADGWGWFSRLRHAARTWWHYHPAHLGLELATPVLSDYARRKPLQYLGLAAAVGALVMITRPWRLVSATGLLVALAKSSQLSSVVLSALSAADFPKDRAPPE